MAKDKHNKEEENKKPRVHKDLEGLDIRINSFGEVVSNFDMDRINDFLNKNVEDKKLEDREGKFGEGSEEEDKEE